MSSSQTQSNPHVLALTDGRIDLARGSLERKGRPTASLSSLELRLLQVLLEADGPLGAADLRRGVWGERCSVTPQAVQQLVRRLRKKLEPDPSSPVHLRFVGNGYRLVVDEDSTTHPGVSLADGWIDMRSRRVNRRGLPPVELTELEYQLLHCLLSVPDPIPVEQLLVDVWGYHPKTKSRAPYVTIQRLRDKLEVDPGRPRHLVCVARSGYRFVPQPSRPCVDLGPPLPGFVGRRAELQQIAQWWSAPAGIWCIAGPPGVGKSRLVREGLSRMGRAATFALSVAPSSGLQEVIEALAKTLGVTLTGRPEQDDPTLALAMRGGDPRLVFDGVDPFVGPLLDRIEQWRVFRPNLRVLLTSRRVPRAPALRTTRLASLSPDDAVEMILLGAQRAGYDWRLTTEARQRLAKLASASLDGLPLALELAAEPYAWMGVDAVQAGIHEGDSVLRGQPSASPWMSLEDALRWSIDRLTVAERRGLLEAAVFSRPFDLDEAQAVLGPSAWTTLDALIGHSLLQVARSSDRPTFTMLTTVRAFVLHHLAVDDPGRLRGARARWRNASEPQTLVVLQRG
ncbi:MAG: winged helix-turn-helix domain-containing protein [Myxococcota bacterium]